MAPWKASWRAHWMDAWKATAAMAHWKATYGIQQSTVLEWEETEVVMVRMAKTSKNKDL